MSSSDVSNLPSLVERALTLYSEGGRDVEVAKLLGITIGRFRRQVEESDSFRLFVEKGRTLSEAWWYEQGRVNLRNKDFNQALYGLNMKNSFGWADKVDTKSEEVELSADATKQRLMAAIKQLGKKDPSLFEDRTMLEIRQEVMGE